MELIAVKTMELSSQNNLSAPESTDAVIIDHLVMMNLLLAAFNMIPALPTDGGRLLRDSFWLRACRRDCWYDWAMDLLLR
jgi:Zn-dependent protease